MPPTVLITRPDPAAQQLARTLRDRWQPAPRIVISPVMAVRFIDQDLALDGARALIFTSRNGVAAFARMSDRRDLPCHVVGEATRAEAERLGLSAVCAGRDADALCATLAASGISGPVWHLHGEHVAGDVAGRLCKAGLDLREAVIYRQEAQELSPEAMACLAGATLVLLPLFSPRSARLFFGMAPRGAAPLLCAVMSDTVAGEVPTEHVHRLTRAERPDMNAMLDSLDELREYAIQLEGTNRAQ